MEKDLELKNIAMFYGTQNYYSLKPIYRTVVTDGVKYIMDNGYSWLVTDALAVIEHKLRGEDFYSIHLNVSDGKAEMEITDGDEHVLWRQKYDYTDARRNLTLYWDSGVLMLSSEY